MRLIPRLVLSLLVVLLAATMAAGPQTSAAKVYVCPMAEHPQEFDKPGKCPVCGMELVEKNGRFRVAVLLFHYAEDIDFTAPIEVLGQSGAQVFTVAATTDPVITVFGLHIQPDYDLAHAPDSDMILVPGGGVSEALKDEKVMAWVRQRASSSRYVMSVCNGAFILARAGLLDGLRATTTASRIEELAAVAPKTQVVRARVVDNGKVITTAGLSAGIDGSLHVIERESGRTRAEDIARGIEYRWQPDSAWTRSALADMRLPDISLPPGVTMQKIASHGDTSRWEMAARLQTAMTADDFLDYAAKQIVAKGWTLRDSARGKRTFAKTGDGRTWLTTVTSTRKGDTASLRETMTIRNVSAER
jgi:putative intracellular protease/amidase